MAKQELRDRIKRQMKNRKLSVPALARSLEVNQQTIYNYLSGKSELTAANLEKLLAEIGSKITFDS